MNADKHGFMYKMRYNLTYRLMTAVLVCILPVCIIGCVLLGVVWNRGRQEVQQMEQAWLTDVMAYWERDCSAIDSTMEYFVSMFIEELNYDSSQLSPVVPYKMFTELERVLVGADHNGLVALRDNHSGQILARMRDPNADGVTIDSQVKAFEARVAQDDMTDSSWQMLDGRLYLVKRFDYRNNSVFFALDIENSILERTAFVWDNSTQIFVTDGAAVMELFGHGLTQTRMSWAECTQSGFSRTASTWHSQKLPIAVCLVKEQSILEMVPAETWLLLVLFVFCVANVATIWRIIRLEVLMPARKLSDAMQQIQRGNIQFRLEDTHYRNSDDMQYLFDTFDEMAGEIEASSRKDKLMYQAEMDNLRLQVNPHMLLNSLNTIYSLAQMKKYDVIQEYALHLVDYFRYALRRNDNLVTLQQELEVVQTYIDIQKIRYPGALSFVYTIDTVCDNALVPPLLIQNFVENCVKYAVKPGKITEILLNVRHKENRMEIRITDTGSGMKPEVLEHLRDGTPYVDQLGHKHIGIWNCRRRIEVFYNEAPQIEILSGNDGTQVLLNVPFITEVPNEASDRG